MWLTLLLPPSLPRTSDCALKRKKVLALDEIESHSWRIQPCSAYTGANLLQGLDWMIDNVSSRIYHYGTIGIGHAQQVQTAGEA